MSESKAEKLSHTWRCRGSVRASITRMEENIAKLEAKRELSHTDRLPIPQLLKNLQKWDAEFKQHHYVILDLIDEEDEALEQEYAIFNDYDDKVTSFMIRLQQVELSARASTSAKIASEDSSWCLGKRLHYIKTELWSISTSIESLPLGPGLDICLLHQLEEQTVALRSDLSEVTRDILSLEGENRDLMEESQG